MGQAGMPDAIRITVGGQRAHPQAKARLRASLAQHAARLRASLTCYRGLAAAITATLAALPTCETAGAQGAAPIGETSLLKAYALAFAQLDRHEIAALALTLGVLCFAVVTAILLVRTRRRLSETEAFARDENIASKAAIDRAYALLLSEPQILIAWAA